MRAVLFLHIPKTAGTSLKRFLYHQLSADACLLDPPGPSALEPAKLDRYRLVAGHLDYDVVERFGRRPFVLTCLRDPIDRALSAYYYQRTTRLAIEIKTAAAQIGEAAARSVLKDLERVNRHDTLAKFLCAEPDVARRTMGNIQTQYLAGAEAVATHAADPERLLSLACTHLRDCDGVLLAERLPTTLEQVDASWSKRAQAAMPRDNTTPGKRLRHEHTAEELAALAELTSLDRALYRCAEQLVVARVGSAAVPPLSPAAPADAADFRFDQPIHGRGWHVRERDGGVWMCWSAGEAALTLSLSTAGDHALVCDVAHAASAEAWASLAVSVNGHDAPLTEKPPAPPGRISAQITGRWLADTPGPIEVGFRVAHTVRPCDRDPANPDTRRLGVAVSRIRLVPASRP